MAIDGVGPKLSVQNSTEYAKDNSIYMRRNDMAQSQAAQQTRTDAERMQNEVLDVYEPDSATIHRERERQRRNRENAEESEAGAQEPEEKQEGGANFSPMREKLPEVSPAYKKIDVRI